MIGRLKGLPVYISSLIQGLTLKFKTSVFLIIVYYLQSNRHSLAQNLVQPITAVKMSLAVLMLIASCCHGL